MGSVTSMCSGRIRVTVSRYRIFAEREGNGAVGGGRLRRFARRARMVFLWVSLAKFVSMKAKIAKNMSVHCVQRQDLRTVTNEPMTGLYSRIS